MKVKKQFFYLFLVSLVCALGFASYLMVPPIIINSHQQYCDVIALISKSPSKNGKTYIKMNGKYTIYNPDIHKGARIFYIKKSDIDINKSNWKSQNMMCRLKLRKIFVEYLFFSIPFFLGSRLTA